MIFVIFMMIEGIIEHGVVKARICYERKQRSVADTLTLNPKNRVLTQSTSGKIFFYLIKALSKAPPKNSRTSSFSGSHGPNFDRHLKWIF